jgi:hypothetical protein
MSPQIWQYWPVFVAATLFVEFAGLPSGLFIQGSLPACF